MRAASESLPKFATEATEAAAECERSRRLAGKPPKAFERGAEFAPRRARRLAGFTAASSALISREIVWRRRWERQLFPGSGALDQPVKLLERNSRLDPPTSRRPSGRQFIRPLQSAISDKLTANDY